MHDMSINPQRPSPADDTNSVADLNNQLYKAYLSGDGAAVERVLALMAKSGAEPAPRSGSVAA
jgi:hypothetical protein